MDMPTSSFAYPAWVSQLADSDAWQALLKPLQMDASALTANGDDMQAAIEPAVMTKLQNDYMHEFSALWEDLLSYKLPTLPDRRFHAKAWHSSQLHAFNAAVYLLNSRFLMAMVDAAQVGPKAKQKVKFAVQQIIDAMCPANFLATNPDAQQKIVESKGESLAKGMAHMLADIRKGHISQTDESAFEVGKNVATTEGAVVYENELFQLIQYKALTKTVHERPLLIVPPCINKYYILDLQPDNSLVRYIAEQKHTVFLVSWRNPDVSLGNATWDDYVEDAVIKAIHVTQEISGREQINTLGFCVGGTLLATALAVLAARGEKPVASLTLLTSFLDFSDTGILDVFVDEVQVNMRERTIGREGLMPGRDFAAAFSSLRPNDLVWNYVGANYLKGEVPPPFDLLYWNADSTNLPGPMFCWYLRNTYLENNLRMPGKVTVTGEQVDFGKIDAPAFIYASREDHIVPWSSAFASTAILNPEKPEWNHFVLGASGHIAGVINPPAKKKRSYWVNGAARASADEWIASATEHPGSWWDEWATFLAKHAGKQVPAPREYGNAAYQPLEPAPGRYVKARAD
ncbi:MAG TPA: class I poly(R)-hydroxyalkanoic acid synthase [Burkholderiaceae bacterium]|nr:class I poly(R)-hydroxyalkanoic acid synthase [Burkholderiaceae bacterium]